jgi:hypothetical protein
MTNPTQRDPLSGGDRLRALENERLAQRRPGLDDELNGLGEYSQAWHQNRSTAYLLRKSWADPVSRIVIAVILGFVAAVWSFLIFF